MTTRAYRDPLEDASLLDPAGQQSMRLRFSGPFQGREVCWDATIEALPGEVSNYYEIGPEGEHGIVLRIGLKAAAIDLPTVRKAILMIRQYKRLSPGRRQFG